MRLFTITSPTNALGVAIYVMMALLGFLNIMPVAHMVSLEQMGGEPVADIWATLVFMTSTAAVYAVLSARKRLDADVSLAIELFASASLAVLMVVLNVSLLLYNTANFPFTSFAMGLTFTIGFIARAVQLVAERGALRTFRDGAPPGLPMK